jgi:hypothetical protein
VPKILQMPAKAVQSRKNYIVHYPRVQRQRFFADFMRDTRLVPEVYHCVIQCEGDREILYWSQHSSLEDAQNAAQTELALITGSSIREVG